MATCSPAVLAIDMISSILLTILGVPGNCLILRVYWGKPHKTSTNVLIMALAWADLFSSAVLLPRILFLCQSSTSKWLIVTVRYISSTTVAFSILLTGLIALDRYDCVCRPHTRILNHRRTCTATVVAFVYSCLNNVPSFILLFIPSPFLIKVVFVLQIVMFLAVLLLVTVCYGLVYNTINKHVRVGVVATVSRVNTISGASASVSQAPPTEPAAVTGSTTTAQMDDAPNLTAHLNGAQDHNDKAPRSQPSTKLQRKTTRMLLISSVIFLALWLPRNVLVAALLFRVRGPMVSNPAYIEVMVRASYVLYVNHVINPLIYGLANRRFREDCKKELKKFKSCWLAR